MVLEIMEVNVVPGEDLILNIFPLSPRTTADMLDYIGTG